MGVRRDLSELDGPFLEEERFVLWYLVRLRGRMDFLDLSISVIEKSLRVILVNFLQPSTMIQLFFLV